jgi:hypothetical protein
MLYFKHKTQEIQKLCKRIVSSNCMLARKWNRTNCFLYLLLKGRKSILSTCNTNILLVTATGWTTEDSWLISRQGEEVFLFFQEPRPDLRPTQPPIQWKPQTLCLGAKWPKRETHSLRQSKAQVKNEFNCTSIPHTQSRRAQRQYYFTLP